MTVQALTSPVRSACKTGIHPTQIPRGKIHPFLLIVALHVIVLGIDPMPKHSAIKTERNTGRVSAKQDFADALRIVLLIKLT